MRLQMMITAILFVLLFNHNAMATGDCDSNGIVTISEVQSAINMFLGLIPPAPCVDEDSSGNVNISEVQKTINTFLGIIPKPVFSVTGAISLNGSAFNGVTLTLYRTSFTIYTIDNLYGAGTPVLNSVEAVSTTGTDGTYSFTGVGSGSYIIVPSHTGYVFNPGKTIFFTIIDNDTKIYIYNSETIHNSVIGNPPTIIYNSTIPITGNTISGWDFTAAIPGGSGL